MPLLSSYPLHAYVHIVSQYTKLIYERRFPFSDQFCTTSSILELDNGWACSLLGPLAMTPAHPYIMKDTSQVDCSTLRLPCIPGHIGVELGKCKSWGWNAGKGKNTKTLELCIINGSTRRRERGGEDGRKVRLQETLDRKLHLQWRQEGIN